MCLCSTPHYTFPFNIFRSLLVLASDCRHSRLAAERAGLRVRRVFVVDCSICPGWWLEPPCTRQKPLLLVGSGDTPVTALQPGQLLGYGSCGTPAAIPRVSRPLHTPLPFTQHSQPAPVQVVLRSAALCGHLNSFTSFSHSILHYSLSIQFHSIHFTAHTVP